MDDPIYLCLDCTRGRIADPLFNSFDVGIGVSRNDGVNYGCGDCGLELPESKRRELKVENLLLRARLAEIVAQVDEIDELSAARFKAEEIAEKAIELAHNLWIAREAFAEHHDEALTQLIVARSSLSGKR